MTKPICASDNELTCISHGSFTKFDISEKEQKLRSTSSLALPLEEELKLLYELTEFKLGQYLLENKGLNGYFTAYIILHGPRKKDLSPLENWILHKAPIFQATRERYQIFTQQLQKHLDSGMTLASIPCGLMDDLMSLDYSKVSGIKLVGIDIDQESLKLASRNAENYSCEDVSFLKKDAWHLNIEEDYDIVVSNGLNIYQPDSEKVILLYKEFYKSLKPGGLLITSFVTPSPQLSQESAWKNFDPDDLRKQRALFGDIIGVAWQKYRTEAEAQQELEQAGFTIKEILYDRQGMFPTVIARKK